MKSAIVHILAFGGLALGLIQPQTNASQSTNATTVGNGTYVLPMFDPNPAARAAELDENRAGYLYGPSLIGNSSFFLTGSLGDQLVQSDVDLWNLDAAPVRAAVQAEATPVLQSVGVAGGLNDLSGYERLYENQWKTANPDGVDPGILTNYSQDLLFSMERLSSNPFPIKRLNPQNDTLPFEIEDKIVQNLTTMSLASLHAAGRLFIVDHSYQANYAGIEGRFTAACTAYFFIDPVSGDLLPLAIKTNVGSDLIYTPLDADQDWLLAKIMFNVNDLFHGQILHLANSHAVAEIVHEAALRTMSAKHPVRAYLDNIMYQAYAIRPIGSQILFNPGGLFDQNFALSNVAVKQFVADFYPTIAGPFRANYLHRSLVDRGLIDCAYGPELAHFPFAEDAGTIVEALRVFATAFVHAYYSNNRILSQDGELQSWVSEAPSAAKVIDFPASPLTHRETLIDILTHLAYLTGVNHHTLNSATPSESSGVLPFHPMALYQPIPTAKGVESVLPYLPNLSASINQTTLLLGFIRPQLFNSARDLENMFDNSGFLAGASAVVRQAASSLQDRLMSISQTIQGRSFDDNGLSQGMPFLWKNLDPSRLPFFLSV
ncbi:MAG: hypothetical protein Q9195_008831 [Heterodermia aff. obscurata]